MYYIAIRADNRDVLREFRFYFFFYDYTAGGTVHSCVIMECNANVLGTRHCGQTGYFFFFGDEGPNFVIFFLK